MRLSRLFVNMPLSPGQQILLPKETAHYLLTVLRLRIGAPLTIFNGQGGEYAARLITGTSKTAQLQIVDYYPIERESFLQLTLVQAISRPEHIDYTIQKAVELGVQRLVPVLSKRSPPVDQSTLYKRTQHWRKIIISACEQSGRNHLPRLDEALPLTAWLKQPQLGICMVLSLDGKNNLQDVLPHSLNHQPSLVTVLSGAEGGLSEEEIQQAMQVGYLDIHLGPRILRTETAAVAVLAICQALAGDLKLMNNEQ
jgi:16S rRNA (uracil1498-N3)-methyltransferase